MNMKMKKINLDKAKDFLFNHGEKVALGTCAALALIFGVMGLLHASSAAKDPKTGLPWATSLEQASAKIKTGIQNAPMPPRDEKTEAQLKRDHYKWNTWESSYDGGPYLQIPEVMLDKRDNPIVLPVKMEEKQDRKEDKYFQLDYHRALVLSYDYDRLNGSVKTLDLGGANAKDVTWMKKAEARRMVVGSAVFPLRDQLRRFKESLRYKSMAELIAAKDDLPKFAGITVVRYELKPDGQPVNPEGEVLVEYRSRGNVFVAEALKSLLKDAIYDDKLAESLEPYLFEGPVMPMPKIANGRFHKLELPGIEVAGEDGMVTPEKKNGPNVDVPKKKSGFNLPGVMKEKKSKEEEKKAAVAMEKLQIGEVKQDTLKKDFPSLYKRLFPEAKATGLTFNIYHILGEFAPEPDPTQKAAGGQPQMNQPKYFAAWDVNPDKTPGANNAAAPPTDYSRDAIVRFIDPDVKPGKTYQYSIQVWLRNPNYKKLADVVQFIGLTAKEDLPPSPRVLTPPITIPKEYEIYAVDQQLLNDWIETGKSEHKWAKDHTTFQIHQWIKSAFEKDFGDDLVIGDWAVAERIDVRKGDPIGQNALVSVPAWKKEKDGFELHGKKPGKKGGAPAFKTTLTPPALDGDNAGGLGLPVLVDFTGGKRVNTSTGKIDEETAVDALVLMPNGKLKVLNSRSDADSKQRVDRLQSTRRRNDGILTSPEKTAGGANP